MYWLINELKWIQKKFYIYNLTNYSTDLKNVEFSLSVSDNILDTYIKPTVKYEKNSNMPKGGVFRSPYSNMLSNI